jgi:glutamyl-tRNA reductase
MVVGLNHRTAPLSMRERFWIGETRRYNVLQQLKSAEGIEEVVVLSTCCRTEFVLWASEPTLAANSLLQFLSADHGLKLTEWERFYRLLDDAAVTHVFRVASGLDSLVLGESQITPLLKAAWEQARTVGACGRFLNAVLEKALAVSERVANETAIGKIDVTIPAASVELAREIFGSLEGRRILLLGTGKMNELSGRRLKESGASSVVVIDQSASRAQELAQALGGTAATLADRWKCMLSADVVISSTGCPHVILTREEAERIAHERNRVALVILDLCVPRDVDAEVRRVDGILLYDLEGMERVARGHASEHRPAVEAAEKIVAAESLGFRGRLHAERTVPTIVALRRRLDEICRQELESFLEERGPFSREQVQSLHAITSQLLQKIASSVDREVKEQPEKEERERMAAAVAQLFHLPSPEAATAGTKLETTKHEQCKERAIAINY